MTDFWGIGSVPLLPFLIPRCRAKHKRVLEREMRKERNLNDRCMEKRSQMLKGDRKGGGEGTVAMIAH